MWSHGIGNEYSPDIATTEALAPTVFQPCRNCFTLSLTERKRPLKKSLCN